jgi:hypothetical protein
VVLEAKELLRQLSAIWATLPPPLKNARHPSSMPKALNLVSFKWRDVISLPGKLTFLGPALILHSLSAVTVQHRVGVLSGTGSNSFSCAVAAL